MSEQFEFGHLTLVEWREAKRDFNVQVKAYCSGTGSLLCWHSEYRHESKIPVAISASVKYPHGIVGERHGKMAYWICIKCGRIRLVNHGYD